MAEAIVSGMQQERKKGNLELGRVGETKEELKKEILEKSAPEIEDIAEFENIEEVEKLVHAPQFEEKSEETQMPEEIIFDDFSTQFS